MDMKCICKRNSLLTQIFVICVTIGLSISANAEETLYLSFDGSTNGQGKSGTVYPTATVGTTEFATGKVGQAFVAGPTHGLVKYPTINIVNPQQGTVAMWVKSVNWSATESAFHVFFQTMGSNGLVLYKYFQNRNLLMLSSQNMGSGPYFSSGINSNWQPGEWHHIAGTWSGDGVLLYVDGVPAASMPSFALLPQAVDREFAIGDASWTTARTSYSLIDEVRIFNQALPGSEIQKLFQGKAVTSLPMPPTNIAANSVQSTGDEPTSPPPTTPPPTSAADALAISTPITASITSKISLSGDTVSIADHQAQFSQSALPTQLKVGTSVFLAAPISVVLNQNNQRTVLSSSSLNIAQLSNSDVTVAQGRLSGSSVALQSKATVERDGLITIELSTASGTAIPNDAELSVEIPLNSNALQYRIRWQNEVRDLVETLKNTSNIDTTPFVPYYWLGNNDSGIFWISDTSRNWPNALAADAIRIDRTSSTTLLFRQKLKAAGQAMPANWKYKFGLQMTPVRKLPTTWRTWRFAPAPNANIELIWPTPTEDSVKYYGYPEPANAQTFTSRVNSIKNNKRLAISYLTPSFISTGAPEWANYKGLWMNGIFDSTSSDVRLMGGTLAGATPTSESWQKFISEKSAQYLDTYKLDGFYFDNAQLYGLYNPQINVGYTANGVTQKEYLSFEYRELFKRVIESAKSKNPSAQIIIHSSGHLAFPVVSMADAYVDGEQFRDVVKDNYLDVIGLDQFRAEFMGRQWGLIPIFLPEFNTENANKVEPTRGLMGLIMLHDIVIWPHWCNIAEVNKALNALDKYGYAQSNFVGYFQPTPPAKSASANIMVSSYQKTNADQLLVAVNTAKVAASGETCMSQSGKYQFTNWLTNQTIANTQPHCFNLNVGVQDYALIRAVNTP